MQMLHMLQLYGPSTPSRLGAWTRLSSGGVTVALDRLEKGGYVRREPNPADRRSLLITLIPTRLRKIAAMYEGVEKKRAGYWQRCHRVILKRWCGSLRRWRRCGRSARMPGNNVDS